MERIKIQGTCNKDYEKVRSLFEENFRKGHEANAQLCIYVDGEIVVDLYGTAIGDANYGPDTLATMFSSGKSIAAIVVAMMVDRGLLNYNQKIESIWPDFGKNGKSNITLADVLWHEAGLPDFNHTMKAADFSRDSIKASKVSDVIEDLEPRWPTKELGCSNPDGSETRRSYHAFTRGWILNEIVRRVDPLGRTIGEIMENEIKIEGLRCGMNEAERKNTSPLKCKSQNWLLLQSMIPKVLGRKIDMNIFDLVKMMRAEKSEYLKLMAKNKISMEELPQSPDIGKMALAFNKPELQRVEIPSANCHGSARGMAKLASVMANLGKYPSSGDNKDEKSLMSHETWKKMHEGEKISVDANLIGATPRTNFTQGGVCVFSQEKYGGKEKMDPMEKAICLDREGFYGWFGLGGSVLQWHPELKIGFGYIPTNLHWWELNTLAGKLQKVTIDCARKIKEAK